MKFKPELQQGELVKRYKRFLADVRTSAGELSSDSLADLAALKSFWAMP